MSRPRPLSLIPHVDLTDDRVRRVAFSGLCAVLLVLAVVGVGGVTRLKAVADRASRAGEIGIVYEEARFQVATEESLERKYRLEPGPGVRNLHRAAGHALDRALRRAATLEPSRRAFVDSVLARHRTYVAATARLFAAVDAGRSRRVLQIDHHQTDPALSAIVRAVDTSADQHAQQGRLDQARLRSTASLMVTLTPIIFAIGLVFLAACGGILLVQRRRLLEVQAQEIERLRRAALTDALTGLGNHRRFHEDLGIAIRRAEEEGSPLALAMVDVDDLKPVNDGQGHQAGDELLIAAARALEGARRTSERVYRVGGDEFIWIMPGTGTWDAAERVRSMQDALLSGAGASVTAGVAERDAAGKDELIRRADLALIEGKRTHRPVILYAPDLERRPGDSGAEDDHHAKTLATALAMAVDAKDSYTRSHCQIVSELSARMGAELGLSTGRIAQLRLAGLLHDVGKIGIPDAILQKPGALTDDEYTVIKTHTTMGHAIVGASDLAEEAEWVLRHHERPDGRGYPSRLCGEEIPLEARVLAVADTFEAITSDRPYQEARSIEVALAELERHAGTQFDPACVDALNRALGRDAPPPELDLDLAAALPATTV